MMHMQLSFMIELRFYVSALHVATKSSVSENGSESDRHADKHVVKLPLLHMQFD